MTEATLVAPVVEAQPTPAGRTSRRSGDRNVVLLGLVSLGYLVVQLAVVIPRMRYLSWDESVYVSQFSRHVPASEWIAARAYGIPLLTAPITLLTPSTEVLRVYLSVLSSAGVFLAYRPWLKVWNTAAVPLAAALFTTLWLTAFYGTQAMPNVYLACCAVAATALFLLAVRPGSPRRISAGLAVAIALAALIRPTDALWLAIPLLGAVLVARGREGLRPAAAIAAGLAAGWIPWMIEAQLRFGGVPARLHTIGETSGNGLHLLVLRHLQSLGGGRTVCGEWARACGPYTLGTVGWWIALPVLVGVGLVATRGSRRFRGQLLAVSVAVSVAFPYFVVTGHANPRYLLPAYAVLALPAAAGLRTLLLAYRRGRPGTVLAGAVLAAVLAHGVVQLTTLDRLTAQWQPGREAVGRMAKRLARLGIRPPCALYGWDATAVAFAAGCRSWDRPLPGPPTGRAAVADRLLLDRALRRGEHVAVISYRPDERRFPGGWRVVRSPRPPYYIQLPPGR